MSEPTTAARTVRELIEALTKLAGELPRGLDTPVEVGLIVDAGTFDASAAFSVEPVTATWPNFRPDGGECRHTTVCLIGDPSHPDADCYTRHEPGPTGHPDWEDPQATDPHGISERRAEPGELCTCGRQAIVVYLGSALGQRVTAGSATAATRPAHARSAAGHGTASSRALPQYRLRLQS
jgi:hypothetical protein